MRTAAKASSTSRGRKFKKKIPLKNLALSTNLNKYCVCLGKKDSVNDVCNTIGSQVVCTNHLGLVCIHVSLVDGDQKFLALNCLHNLLWLEICGQYLSRQHMIRQNIDKLVLVFRLEQAVQSSLRESSEGLICWCKDGEWTWRAEGFGKISCDNCPHQCGEIIHRLGQFHDVWLNHQGRMEEEARHQ